MTTKKTAVIIGASSEIGQATAAQLATDGFSLALTYNTNADFPAPAESKKYHLDLSAQAPKDAAEKFFAQVQKDFAYISTLVFCAGVAQKRALILDVRDEEIDKLFEVNTKAAVRCVREFCKITVNHHPASVVLVGSFAEKVGCSCESIYTATKAALGGLCKSLAGELGNLDVRINVVAPGFINTKMNNNLDEEEKEGIAEMTPLKRLGTPQDVANAISFFAGESSSFITGQTLFVDGGLILE